MATLPAHRLILIVAMKSVFAFVFMLGACANPDHRDNLAETVKQVEEHLDARIGIAVHDEQSGRRWEYNTNDRFPMLSTFKTLACAVLLSRVDAGKEDLDRVMTIEQNDLVTYSPITETRVGSAGMSLAELCEAAMFMSDNSAANLILDAIGGPGALTDFMRSIGDETTRLDRREPDLNEATPGDLRDTTTPNSMAMAYKKIVLGDVLSPKSRQMLADWLVGNKVGDALLRTGVPNDWKVGDRTGTGGHGSRAVAAIMWPPGRAPVVAVVYITETDATIDDRNAAMAKIGKAIADAVLEPKISDNAGI